MADMKQRQSACTSLVTSNNLLPTDVAINREDQSHTAVNYNIVNVRPAADCPERHESRETPMRPTAYYAVGQNQPIFWTLTIGATIINELSETACRVYESGGHSLLLDTHRRRTLILRVSPRRCCVANDRANLCFCRAGNDERSARSH